MTNPFESPVDPKPSHLEMHERAFDPVRPAEILPFHQYERNILLHALNVTGWNVKETARRLQIGRATLYRKIDRYDLRSFREIRDAG